MSATIEKTYTWLTNTGVSSARLYWENKVGFFNIKGVTVPAPAPAGKGTLPWQTRGHSKDLS